MTRVFDLTAYRRVMARRRLLRKLRRVWVPEIGRTLAVLGSFTGARS